MKNPNEIHMAYKQPRLCLRILKPVNQNANHFPTHPFVFLMVDISIFFTHSQIFERTYLYSLTQQLS